MIFDGSVGVDIVHNLMEDARRTCRWYLVVTMGRKAGHLALGIGKAAGATIRSLPFEEMIDPDTGRTRVRMEAVDSQSFQVALEYMIRLRPEGMDDNDQVRRLADAAGAEPETFRRRFASLATSPARSSAPKGSSRDELVLRMSNRQHRARRLLHHLLCYASDERMG